MSVVEPISENGEIESELSDPRAPTKGALKPPAAATFLGVSKDTLAHWRCRGVGPAHVKLGRAVVYRVETLEAFLLAHEK